MDDEVSKVNRNERSENSSDSQETEKSLVWENHINQHTDDEGEMSNRKENNPCEEFLGSKEEILEQIQEKITADEEACTQNKEDIIINEEETSPHEKDMAVGENLTLIKVYVTSNKEEPINNKEGFTQNIENPIVEGMVTSEEAMTEGEKKNGKNLTVNKAGTASHGQETATASKESMIINEEKPATGKESIMKIQKDSNDGMTFKKEFIDTNQADIESNLANLSFILERKRIFQWKYLSRIPATREIYPHSLRRSDNIMAFYNKLRRDSVDSSTNTSFVTYQKQQLRNDDGSYVNDDPRPQRNLVTEFSKGLMERHMRFFDILPEARKFMFFVPLHYGVYFIMCLEQIFFFLRGYTRILDLALPKFFPWLKNWLLICELLLALFILASDIFLLVGIFLKPSYIFFWLDIHILEVVAYVCIIISLDIVDSGCVWECRLIYCCYIMCFVYFIITVNALRMSYQLPLVNHVNLESHHVV